MLDVSPAAQEAAALGVQEHDERLRDGVDLEPEVRTPTRRSGMGVQFEALQDPTEAQALGVENPGAVTRLKDKESVLSVFCGAGHGSDHARSITQINGEFASGSLRNDDNRFLPCSHAYCGPVHMPIAA